MDQSDFINIYIQTLVSEVEELSKSKLVLVAKEKFKDQEIGELKDDIVKLEESVAKEKDEVSKTWQLALSEKDTEVAGLEKLVSESRREAEANKNKLAGMTAKFDESQTLLAAKDEKIAKLEAEVKLLKPEPEPVVIKTQKKKGNKRAVDTVTLK